MTSEIAHARAEAIRRRTLRRALRAARLPSGRRLQKKRLAAALGIGPARLSEMVSGDESLPLQRFEQAIRAIGTLVKGESAPADDNNLEE